MEINVEKEGMRGHSRRKRSRIPAALEECKEGGGRRHGGSRGTMEYYWLKEIKFFMPKMPPTPLFAHSSSRTLVLQWALTTAGSETKPRLKKTPRLAPRSEYHAISLSLGSVLRDIRTEKICGAPQDWSSRGNNKSKRTLLFACQVICRLASSRLCLPCCLRCNLRNEQEFFLADAACNKKRGEWALEFIVVAAGMPDVAY